MSDIEIGSEWVGVNGGVIKFVSIDRDGDVSFTKNGILMHMTRKGFLRSFKPKDNDSALLNERKADGQKPLAVSLGEL